MENATWIGVRKGEINAWPAAGCTKAQREELIGKVRVEKRSILFRRTIRLDRPIRSATLRICGLGYYYAFLNGKPADPACVLMPLYSDYSKRVSYDRYDVTPLLHTGENVIAVEVGGGWFCPPEKWWSWRMAWFGNPRLIAALTVTFEDGAVDTVTSDETWRLSYGGVQSSCIYDGEGFDASKEPKGWKTVGFDDSAWQNAAVVEAPAGRLSERLAPPIRVIRILKSVAEHRLDDCRIIYDFGENTAALPCITVKGKQGDSVTLNHAEFVYEDGTLDMRSNNRAACEDVYRLGGEEAETYRPRFTWHGFRYLMLTLSSPDIKILKAEAQVIHSDVKSTGIFSCSRDDLNRMHDVIRRTALSCLIGIPLDCPQRDERLPWLGDVHAADEVYLYNFDMETLYESYLEDIRLGRSPRTGAVQFIAPRPMDDDTSIDWNIAYPILLADCYRRYGNKELLRRHYPALKEHTGHYVSIAKDGLIENSWFGDWFSTDQAPGVPRGDGFATSKEGDNQNPPYCGSLFYYQTLALTAEIAGWLGESEDETYFRSLSEKTRLSLLQTHFNAETGVFGRGGQFSQTYPLALGVIRGADRKKAMTVLLDEIRKKDGHCVMGVMGYRRIFDLLRDEGKPEAAYALLTKEGYPGILDMVGHDRTTLPEWPDGAGGSGCHVMFGSPDAALYRLLGGVTVDFSREVPIEIAPYIPSDLSFVSCEQELKQGTLSFRWEKKGGRIAYRLDVPDAVTVRFRCGQSGKERILACGTHAFCDDDPT